MKKNQVGENCTIINSKLINCQIGDNVKIENSILKNCILYDFVSILQSNLEGCVILKHASIGPFSRIRPDTLISKNVRIGNFVEIKNSVIGENTKINHLAYVGDAEVGANCNIGCGVVFANFDGKVKRKTTIGKNSFIGSNSNLIAPLTLAPHTFVACGSTVTEDTEEFEFVISRTRQTTKKGYAKRYFGEKKER